VLDVKRYFQGETLRRDKKRSGLMRKFIALGSALLLFWGPLAGADDLFDLYKNSSSHLPFVAFMARESGQTLTKPGHAFVAVGTELDNGLLFYEAIFGYYPQSDSAAEELKLVWTSGPGSLTFKFKDLNWDVQFRRSVTAAEKAAAMAVVKRWQTTDPKYNLFNNGGRNCSAFASEVATAVGLKAPPGPGTKLPMTYIRELKQLNGGS
jgi:hypothetical protein